MSDELEARIAALEGRLERMHRPGSILDDTDIDLSDPTKPRARIHIDDDDDGNPVKSPWLPYATIAGARNQHDPPSKGQQFMLIAPDGEHEAGLLIPLGHSNNVPSPSTETCTFVDSAGQTDIRFKDGKHRVQTGTDNEHLVTTDGQRIKVTDISKLIFKFGDTPYKLLMSALEPATDLGDF